MNKVFEKIQDWYWSIWPYDYRIGNLYYKFKCWAYHRYTTVKPRTLPFHTWCDRDHLMVHCNFEILSQFMEKELRGYKEEDWEYYYKEQPDSLVEFGGAKKDPYYVLDYIYRWWKFYNEKEEKLGDAWYKFNNLHCKHEFNPIENTQLLSWDTVWDSEENEKTGNIMFKRYQKKNTALEKELEENLILLIKLRHYLWT